MRMKSRRPSPILGVASAMINEASDNLVSGASRFRHSFEAAMETIQPDPNQPRKIINDDDIASLAATMEERGQLQPILLRRDPLAKGRWFIVAGERRWRAAKRNGWFSILAIEHDGDPEVASLLENLQRVDLTPVEEARGLQRLIEEKNWTQDQAADAIGKPKSDISGTLRILTLPADLLEAVLTSEPSIPKNVLIELARVENEPVRTQLLRIAREGSLTVRVIRQMKDRAAAALIGGDPKRLTGEEAHGFSFRSLERLLKSLQVAREAGCPVLGKERDCLVRLRREIDELLRTQSVEM